jgi:hypothetical protein
LARRLLALRLRTRGLGLRGLRGLLARGSLLGCCLPFACKLGRCLTCGSLARHLLALGLCLCGLGLLTVGYLLCGQCAIARQPARFGLGGLLACGLLALGLCLCGLGAFGVFACGGLPFVPLPGRLGPRGLLPGRCALCGDSGLLLSRLLLGQLFSQSFGLRAGRVGSRSSVGLRARGFFVFGGGSASGVLFVLGRLCARRFLQQRLLVLRVLAQDVQPRRFGLSGCLPVGLLLQGFLLRGGFLVGRCASQGLLSERLGACSLLWLGVLACGLSRQGLASRCLVLHSLPLQRLLLFGLAALGFDARRVDRLLPCSLPQRCGLAFGGQSGCGFARGFGLFLLSRLSCKLGLGFLRRRRCRWLFNDGCARGLRC